MNQVEDRLKRVVLETLKIQDADYHEDLTAGDLPAWDSIGHVNLLMAVEKEFDVAFDVNDAIDIESVADLHEMVRKYLALKPGQ